jgi:hypothetical protein
MILGVRCTHNRQVEFYRGREGIEASVSTKYRNHRDISVLKDSQIYVELPPADAKVQALVTGGPSQGCLVKLAELKPAEQRAVLGSIEKRQFSFLSDTDNKINLVVIGAIK